MQRVQECLKSCRIDCVIQLWILLPSGGWGEENGRHKSGSLVPDVRTKRSASLISVSDTGFECGTLVSLSR